MANDRLSINGGDNYIWPGFARLGLSAGKFATDFLFSDPANPFANMPDQWKSSGLVRSVTRSLVFAGVTSGTATAPVNFRPTNGRNFLIMWRMAEAVQTGTGTAISLAGIKAKQTQADGTLLDDYAPSSNLFGTAQQPYVFGSTFDAVLGTATRQWEITNTSSYTADVTLTFSIAFLDLIGR